MTDMTDSIATFYRKLFTPNLNFLLYAQRKLYICHTLSELAHFFLSLKNQLIIKREKKSKK